MADYGIVIGIDAYPGLTTLKGPRNDANAFYAWLTDKNKGNVPPENVSRLECNGPVPGLTVRNAVPTRQLLDDLFRPLAEAAGAGEKYGERLFIYLAGHGFADNRDPDSAALLSAEANQNWPAHLAVLAYVNLFRRMATFDEIIVLIDACRVPDLSWPIAVPTIADPVSSPEAKKVKYFVGFGTYFGDVSREKNTGGGVYRGVFTLALMDALAHAQPEPDGRLLGSKVKTYIDHYFKDFAVKPNDEAEIDANTARDVVFMTYPPAVAEDGGGVAEGISESAPVLEMKGVQQLLATPTQKTICVTVPDADVDKRLLITGAGVKAIPITAALFFVDLEPGAYKAQVEGQAASILFEVPVDDAITLG